MDIINPSNYLKNMENRAIKNNTWSMYEIINDLEKNVIFYGTKFKEFKDKTRKFILLMDNNYEKNNLYLLEVINKDFLKCFYSFLSNEILTICDSFDNNFYDLIKNQIYDNLILTDKLIIKLNNKENDDKKQKLMNMTNKLMENYCIIKNVLKLYYKSNKENIKYEDHILVNIKKSEEIKYILKYKSDNNLYYYQSLPKIILERYSVGINKSIYFIENSFSGENIEINNFKKVYYIYDTIIINTSFSRFIFKTKFLLIFSRSILNKYILLDKLYLHPKCIKLKNIS